MCLFPTLLWCSAIVGRCGGPNTFPYHSRFGAFNSPVRLGEFPVRAATGIRSQGIDLSYCFCGQTAVAGGKSMKFPVRREKPGILHRSSRPIPKLGDTAKNFSPAVYGESYSPHRSSGSASAKRRWPLTASSMRSRHRRSIPSFVICTPNTGCSSSSSSEYSFDPRNMMPSDCVRPELYSPSDPPAARPEAANHGAMNSGIRYPQSETSSTSIEHQG
jgi:hypothetical protein